MIEFLILPLEGFVFLGKQEHVGLAVLYLLVEFVDL